jgi:hypothetical protein
MNCPKCTTPSTAGASHCRRCGAPLTAKAAAASSAIPDEIDLMPMEPVKESSYSPYEPPPGPGAAPAAAPEAKSGGTKTRAPKPPPPPPSQEEIEAERKGKVGLYISGAILALFFLFIGWRMVRPKHEILTPGQAKVDSSATLNPNQVQVKKFEILGTWTYNLEVTALDSEISVGVFKWSPGQSSKIDAVKSLPEGLDTASKDETFKKTGELKSGTYSWVLINEGKKPAKVKFKFRLE